MIPEQLLKKAQEKGTTEQYEAYVRLLPSCLTNDYKEYPHGEGRSVFAHVRKGGGVAFKPPYSGVPLTQQQHHGYEYYNPIQWWERKAIDYLCKWINNVPIPQLPEKRTKETFNIESVSHLKAIEELLVEYFKNPNAKPINITVETDRRKRTIQQNKGQWGVVYNNIGQLL